jgi:hypothetical protein
VTEVPEALPTAVFSRRRVLGLGAAAGLSVMVGCSADSGEDDDRDSGPRAAGNVEVTPDVKTATAALAAIRATHQAVRATVQRFPGTGTRLAALSSMHAAHERSLVQAVPARVRSSAVPTPYAVPRRPDPALARLQVAEGRLHDSLQALSLAAESGEFARLLASMAAGVTVHRNVLATGRA